MWAVRRQSTGRKACVEIAALEAIGSNRVDFLPKLL